MTPDRKLRQWKVSPAQDAAVDAMLSATGELYTAMCRRLFAQEAARLGLSFPDDVLSQAENARKTTRTRTARRK